MKATRRVEFVMYGLHPALFCSEVDQYFICPICYFVASDPVSCISCEQIFCSGCIDRYSKIKNQTCPKCKESLSTSPLRKFPRKVYESFFLYCPNYNNQCRFEGGIKEIHDHKQVCDYMKINCQNPLCAQNFLAKDRPIPDADVCSIQCMETYSLSKLIQGSNKLEISKFFWNCLQSHRKRFAQSIEMEFDELNCAGDLARKTWEADIGELERKYEEVKRHTHSGKFTNEVWTCCQQAREAMGCSLLYGP